MKKLVIEIRATSRKRRELERALRTFIDEYEDKRGVYDIKVLEENTAYLSAINISAADKQSFLDEEKVEDKEE